MEGIQCCVQKSLDVVGGGIAGHQYISERVDGGLDQNIGDGKEGTLNSGGKADPDHFHQLNLVETHFLQFQLAGIGAAHQRDHHHDGRECLRNNGGEGNAGHIHIQHCYEDHVQRHIDHTCDGQVNQGAFGVSGVPQDGGAEIVDHGKDHAGEIDAHINRGKGKYILRGAHQFQKGGGKDDTNDRDKNSADQCSGNCCMDGPVGTFLLPAADGMGHGHTGANGKSHKQIDDQIGDRAGGTHGGDGNTAAETAHNDQVCRIKQQLEYTGENDGDRVQDDAGNQRPLKHIR